MPENRIVVTLCTSEDLTSQGFSEVFFHSKDIYT